MYLDIIKNPIFLGVLAGALTYLYLLWSNNDKNDDKRKKDISLFTPIVVAIIVCVISYAYFNYFINSNTSKIDNTYITDQIIKNSNLTSMPIKNNLEANITKTVSSDSASFHLISKGVNIPNSLPDVFIETTY